MLDVKIYNKDQRNLLEKFKKKHDYNWKSRRLIQLSIDDWIDEPKSPDIYYGLMPKPQL